MSSNNFNIQADAFSVPVREEVLWLPEKERRYRLNRKEGKIHIDLSSQTREVGTSLEVLILQYYSFSAEIFGAAYQDWVQLAFLDPDNIVSIAYLNSGTTSALQPWIEYVLDLAYRNIPLASVVTRISFVQRFSKKSSNAFHSFQFSSRNRTTEEEKTQYELAKKFVRTKQPVIIGSSLPSDVAVSLFAQSQNTTVEALSEGASTTYLGEEDDEEDMFEEDYLPT